MKIIILFIAFFLFCLILDKDEEDTCIYCKKKLTEKNYFTSKCCRECAVKIRNKKMIEKEKNGKSI